MAITDPTNPWGSLLSGFVTGFANQMTTQITEKAEQKRLSLTQEAKFLSEVLNDTAGQYSQADRDAAVFALAELARGDKPGAGLKSFEKRRKELMEKQTTLAVGDVAGGGRVAGAPSPVIGGGAPLPGSTEAAEEGSPGRPASYRPGGPPDASGAGSAAMPPTSPTVSRGTAAGIAPGAPIGGPPAAPLGPAAGAPAPAQGPPGAPPAAPTQEQVAEFGRGMGLTPPAQPVPPQRPNPYTARKLDLEFYEKDMLQYKTDQQAYTEWFVRVAVQMHQERKQKETQDFQAKESEKERGFKKEEGEKDRASRERAAALRGAGKQDPADRDAALIRRQAIATYHRELNDIEDAKDDFGVGRLGEEEKQARRERAAANYRAATGEDPPRSGALDVKPLTSRSGGDEKLAKPAPPKKLPGGPPEAPQDLRSLKDGDKVIANIEKERRAKVPLATICKDIDTNPSAPPELKAAARLYARCP